MNIETDRLYIRSLLADDWQKLKIIFQDFNSSPYAVYDAPFPATDPEIQKLTANFAASGLFFAVLLKGSSELIGYVCFHNNNGSYDLGYCFHSDYQGKGYALEACQELLRFIKLSDNVKEFTAGTALKNIPSCKLLKRLGFTLQETEILSFHKDSTGKELFLKAVFSKRRTDSQPFSRFIILSSFRLTCR